MLFFQQSEEAKKFREGLMGSSSSCGRLTAIARLDEVYKVRASPRHKLSAASQSQTKEHQCQTQCIALFQ